MKKMLFFMPLSGASRPKHKAKKLEDTMQTIITMLMELKKADRFSPGCHVSVENEPYMRLVIEYLDERGPDGHPVVSIAHCERSARLRDGSAEESKYVACPAQRDYLGISSAHFGRRIRSTQLASTPSADPSWINRRISPGTHPPIIWCP